MQVLPIKQNNFAHEVVNQIAKLLMKSTGDMVLIRKGGSEGHGKGEGEREGERREGELEGERRVEKKMGDRRRRGDREEWGVVGMGGKEDPRDCF
ncbi:hypothetical protein Sjap_026017 [Stephania japonica]|uniref:Uncharacterized protein n=1 Tax=Stephania japonica TaxID=461633 RepID=A0AAP0HIH6_9MAGN